MEKQYPTAVQGFRHNILIALGLQDPQMVTGGHIIARRQKEGGAIVFEDLFFGGNLSIEHLDPK